MNDEIKLMLNIIKDVSERKEGSRNGLMILSCKDYKQLLDYITNLQQELEEEKRIEEADLKTIQRLEEENERLKDTLAKIKDLNTMQYLNEKNFKYSLNEILQNEDEEK